MDEEDICVDEGVDKRLCYDAMIEAMDYELRRLINAAGVDTTIILVGDNGTPAGVTPDPPYDPTRMKLRLYEGGINVPLIIRPASGWSLGVAESDALVHTVDLFWLVLRLAGADEPAGITLDSQPISGFAPVGNSTGRKWVLAEKGCDKRAVRNDRYKLIDRQSTTACADGTNGSSGATCDEFFDLEDDPFEANNLIYPSPFFSSGRASRAYIELRDLLANLDPCDP